jgi:hypothetical protein
MVGVGGLLGMLLDVELRTYTIKTHINSQNDIIIQIHSMFCELATFHGIFFIFRLIVRILVAYYQSHITLLWMELRLRIDLLLYVQLSTHLRGLKCINANNQHTCAFDNHISLIVDPSLNPFYVDGTT